MVIGYTYDAQGRLIAKRVDGMIEYRLIYSGQLSPVAKVDADGDVLELYISGTGANSPDYIVKAGSVYRVIKDHLGSTRMIVNANTGDIAQEITYNEFGIVITDTNPGFQPFYFAGGIYDLDTQLVKFGARDYDPETGRWISKEPLGFAGSNNFYAYVDGDPVNFVDVNGQFRFLSEKQLNAEFSDVKEEYLALMKYLITRFKSRLESERGKRYIAYNKFFNASEENVNKIFPNNMGPLITIDASNAKGSYANGKIFINKGNLGAWDMKSQEIYRLVEHELAHYFDETYNNNNAKKEFLSKVCDEYQVVKEGYYCTPRYEEGSQMYRSYYVGFEAGAIYEGYIYKSVNY